MARSMSWWRGVTPWASRAERSRRPSTICGSTSCTCRILGASVMRVVGSSLDYRNDPHGPQIERLTGIFKECAKMAGDEGVKLADENHFDFTTDEYLGLFQAVGSPHFGMCFDTGNCLRNGDEPVESARKLGRHIFATHTKDVAPLVRLEPEGLDVLCLHARGQGDRQFPRHRRRAGEARGTPACTPWSWTTWIPASGRRTLQ